jgi:hypothetical protein
MKTPARKLCIGLASNDSLTNLPKASRFVCCVLTEDERAISIIIGLQLGVSYAWKIKATKREAQSRQKALWEGYLLLVRRLVQIEVR